jgi:hypothetical protein
VRVTHLPRDRKNGLHQLAAHFMIGIALIGASASAAIGEDYYWSFKVATSDISGASTNANVKVWVKGDKATTPKIRIDSSGADFDQGKTGAYTVVTNIDIGKPEKWGILHDDSGRGSGWHLASVEISYLGKKGAKALWTQHFKVDKWLSNDKDGYKGNRLQSLYYEDEFTPPDVAVTFQPPGGDWRDYPTDRYQKIEFIVGPQNYTLEAEKATTKTASLSRSTGTTKENSHSFTAGITAEYTHGFSELSSATIGVSVSDTTTQRAQTEINKNKQMATASTRAMKDKREVKIKDNEVMIALYEIVEVRSLTPGHLILGEDRLEFTERTFYGQPHFEIHAIGSQTLLDRIAALEKDERFRGLMSKEVVGRIKKLAPPKTTDSSHLANRIDTSKKELTDLRDKLLASRAKISNLEKMIADVQVGAKSQAEVVAAQDARRNAISSELLARVAQLEQRLKACCDGGGNNNLGGNKNFDGIKNNLGGNNNLGNNNLGNNNQGGPNLAGTLFGDFVIRGFENEDDEIGFIAGTINIQRDGSYTRSLRGGATTRGKLTTEGEAVTLIGENATLGGTHYELDDENGYGVELANGEYEQWENGDDSQENLPGTLIGDFRVRRFQNDNDQLGLIVGAITIQPDGSFTRTIEDRPAERGKLTVRGDELTLHIENPFAAGGGSGGGPVNAEFYEIEGGFGVEQTTGYEQWENGEVESDQPGALVGSFQIREFADDEDNEGKVIGTITVTPDGRYTTTAEGQTKQGRLAVRGESLTLDDGNEQILATVYPIDVGYGLELPLGGYHQWERQTEQDGGPPATLVGDFVIRAFRNDQDEEGFIAGTIKTSADGRFLRTMTDRSATQGTLTVNREVITMESGGRQTQAVYYEITGGFGIEIGEDIYEQWELENNNGSTIQIPESLVGEFLIRFFESDDDEEGYPGGTMKIEQDGRFQRSVRDKPATTGRLTVRGDTMTMVENGQSRQAIYYELEDGGYGVEDIGNGFEVWEKPGDDSNGPVEIPATLVGEFRIRRFESDTDEQGHIAGMITIRANGSFTMSLRDEPVAEGTLTLVGETLTVNNGRQPVEVNFYPIEEIGYGVELKSGYEQWEPDQGNSRDNASAIPGTLVGNFRIRRFGDQGDEGGFITGTMRIDDEGTYTRELHGMRPLRGSLHVFGQSMTLDHGAVKFRTEFYTGRDIVQIARLDDGEEVWERIVDERPETVIVGTFSIRAFKPNDNVGFVAGTMRIDEDGTYQRVYNGEQFNGRLTTNGELLTLTEEERHVRTRFVATQRSAAIAYDIENAGAGHEIWENAIDSGDEQVPDEIVGAYSIRKFAGADDEVGFIAGTMTIAKNGSYTRVYNDQPFNGQLTVEGQTLSLKEGNRTVRTEFYVFNEGPGDEGLEIKNAGSGFEEWTKTTRATAAQ